MAPVPLAFTPWLKNVNEYAVRHHEGSSVGLVSRYG